MGFPRQEHWSMLPLPSPGILPTQRSNLHLLFAGRFFPLGRLRKPHLGPAAHRVDDHWHAESKGDSGCLAIAGCPSPFSSASRLNSDLLRCMQRTLTKETSLHCSESENWASNSPVCKYLSHLQALLNIILAQEIFLLCVPRASEQWVRGHLGDLLPEPPPGVRGRGPSRGPQLTGWRWLPKMPRATYACSQNWNCRNKPVSMVNPGSWGLELFLAQYY